MSRVFVFNAKDDVFVTEGILSEDIINGEALVDKLQELGMNGLIKAEMDKYRASHPHLDYL